MALLEVRELTKTFGGLIANNRISLDVDAATIVGVIGPNGAGKSTLFNGISGFHRPTSGRVILDGRDITGLAPHRVCGLGLARTFQIAEVFTEVVVAARGAALPRKRSRRPFATGCARGRA